MSDGWDQRPPVTPLLSPKERAWVERALILVKHRARFFARKYAGLVDPEEFVTVGKIGVVEVVRRYDEARDASFEGYAVARIDGQMLTLVRAATKAKQRDQAMHRAAACFRAHHHAEYDLLKEGPEALRARLQTFSDDLAAVAFMAALEEKRRMAPDDELGELVEYAQAMRLLGEALGELSEDERRVLGALYVDNLDMREAEVRLDVPYITVRRRAARAQEKLRKALVKRGMRDTPSLRDVEGIAPVLKGLGEDKDAGAPV